MDVMEIISVSLVTVLCLAWLALELMLCFQLSKTDKLLAAFSLENSAGSVLPCVKAYDTGSLNSVARKEANSSTFDPDSEMKAVRVQARTTRLKFGRPLSVSPPVT